VLGFDSTNLASATSHTGIYPMDLHPYMGFLELQPYKLNTQGNVLNNHIPLGRLIFGEAITFNNDYILKVSSKSPVNQVLCRMHLLSPTNQLIDITNDYAGANVFVVAQQ